MGLVGDYLRHSLEQECREKISGDQDGVRLKSANPEMSIERNECGGLRACL